MNTLLLDRTAWDLVLDAGGNMALATDPYSIAQDVASAIQTFISECWYDTTKGVPYWDKILGKYPSMSYMKETLKNVALTIDGVVDALVVFISFQDRVLTGQVQVTTSSGIILGVSF